MTVNEFYDKQATAFDDLRNACEEYFALSGEARFYCDNIKNKVFEKAMEYVMGKDVWDRIRENESKEDEK